MGYMYLPQHVLIPPTEKTDETNYHRYPCFSIIKGQTQNLQNKAFCFKELKYPQTET
jgi:hypothetical protein